MNIKYKITKAVDKAISKEKQNDIKYYFRIGITLLLIAAITATLLAFVNALTKEKIAENERAVMQEAIGRIFEDCKEIKEVKGEYESPVVAVYEVYGSENSLLGYGVQTAPTGFKEAIGIIVGVDIERKCVGVEITSISDTPGVGTKVKESSFLEGFVGFDSVSVNEVDTISGATISSSAVKSGVAAALALDLTPAEDVEDEATSEIENEEENIPEQAEENTESADPYQTQEESTESGGVA